MAKGNFIWADLSTYNTRASVNYYSTVFDWEVSDDGGYHILTKNETTIAGLYETPSFFKKIGMPHFWMSYFQVASVSEATKIAESNGGKVELTNLPFSNGKIALIRDPLGAGFTIYEGNDLQLSINEKNRSLLKTELHTSDLERVRTFYSEIFGWSYNELDNSTYDVLINNEASNIRMLEVPNKLKGKYEYWVLTFKIKDVATIYDRILKAGGQLIFEETDRILVSDNSNEAFFYIESQ